MARLPLGASDPYPDRGGLTRSAAPVQPPGWQPILFNWEDVRCCNPPGLIS